MLVLLTTSAAYALLRHYTAAFDRLDVFGEGHGHSKGGALNYLLVGSDSGEGLSAAQLRQFHLGARRATLGQRADTMILVHVSKKRDKALLVSFPRDSYVLIPAYTDAQGHKHPAQHNKLNAAFSFGGPRLAIATIEKNTGLTVDHYVQINVLGLANVVNSLGGVDVCLPQAVNDRDSGLDLSAGEHHVDGVTAVAYARNRHGLTGGSDIGRIKRQQALMGSLFRQATSTGTLLNLVKLHAFLNAAVKAVKVDKELSQKDMFTLADKLRHVDAKHITMMTVPLAKHYVNHGIGSTVDWDPVEAPRLFADINADRPVATAADAPKVTVAPSRIFVSVRNGTDTQGLGRRAADDLVRVGFHIRGTPSNAASKVPGTVVRYGPSRADSAQTVAAAVPGATLQQDASLGDNVQIVVGPNYSGVRTVTVSKPSPQSGLAGARTAADNPCS